MYNVIDHTTQTKKKKRDPGSRIKRSYVTIDHIHLSQDIAYFDLFVKFRNGGYVDYSAWPLSAPFLAPYIGEDGDMSRLLALIGKKAIFRVSYFIRSMDHGNATIHSLDVIEDECASGKKQKSVKAKKTFLDEDADIDSDEEAD